MTKILIISAIFLSVFSYSQNKNSNDTPDRLEDLFKNGTVGFYKIMNEELSKYPELRKEGVNGNIYYQVTIDTMGGIKNMEIIKTPDKKFIRIIIRALKKTKGHWYPKVVNGKKEEYFYKDRVYFKTN